MDTTIANIILDNLRSFAELSAISGLSLYNGREESKWAKKGYKLQLFPTILKLLEKKY
jgi:hypothetical protein